MSARFAAPVIQQALSLQRAMIGAIDPEATALTVSRELPPAPAPAKRGTVAVLGAGIAGLTIAYELRNRGYDLVILEATERAGGRNRTVRRGDVLFELNDGGGLEQTHECRFDHGLYLNIGPGRIPHHHRRVLGYCYDFGVALEPYIMETTAAFESLHTNGTAVRWRNRQVANDTRGYIAAKLAEYLQRKRPKPAADDPTLSMLRTFGALDKRLKYQGSTRSGYAQTLNVHAFEKPIPPLDFDELIASRFWEHRFYQPVDYLWQGTMFQPVGGMDRIVTAFEQRVGRILRTNAVVSRITLNDPGVTVHYRRLGRDEELKVDYCISSIPVSVLREQIALSNFSDAFERAIETVPFEKTCKVGWQAEQRFWENDENQIYGGISWTDDIINQVWFPSNDYFSAHGTLTGAYNFADDAERLGKMHPSDRLRAARDCAKLLHPQFADDKIVPLDKGLSIAWHKVPFQLGGFAAWDPSNPDHKAAYRQLLTPEANGPFFVTGDQASPLPGWQEGAMMSAHYVLNKILGVTPAKVPEIVRVPDATVLTQGLY